MLCVGLQTAAPGVTRAYEDQATLGVDVGYAHATAKAWPHAGAVLGIEASLGLDDIWTVRAFASYSLHPAAQSLSMASLGGELLYLVDVLEWVPYFGAGVTALGSWFGFKDGLHIDCAVHPVVGLDWLVSRDLALGVVVRPEFLITAWDHEPLYLSAALSASLLLDL